MNRNKSFFKILIIILFVLLVMGGGLYLLFRDYLGSPEEVFPETPPGSPDHELMILEGTTVELYGEDSRWELKTGDINYHRGQEDFEFSPVWIQVFDGEAQEPDYMLTAEWGDYDSERELLYIEGQVELIAPEFNIRTENLSWQQEQEFLAGSGGFWMETPAFVLEGSGFESDSFFEDLKVVGNDEQVSLRFKEERSQD